jgi:hypothetical protein
MIFQNKYDPHLRWEAYSFETAIEDLLPNGVEDRTHKLAEIVARMLEAMPLTNQQRLDIIDPYSNWEIVKEPK